VTQEPQPSGVVRAFFWFCIVVIGLDATLLLPPLRPLREALVQFAGWLPSMPYLFSLRVFPRTRTDDETGLARKRRSLLVSAGLLVAFAAFGVASFVAFDAPVRSTNPWLRISTWGLVWTCVLPAVWAYLLFREAGRVKPQC
jgi:hypothetical protein